MKLLNQLFILLFSSQLLAAVDGAVEQIRSSEQGVLVEGWACIVSYNEAATVKVHLKANNQTLVSGKTKFQSARSIHRKCNTKRSVPHGFSLLIKNNQIAQYPEQEFVVSLVDKTQRNRLVAIASSVDPVLPNLNYLSEKMLARLNCIDQKEMYHGYLCALRPSLLDPDSRDQKGTKNVLENSLGFGYHTIAIPKNFDLKNQILVHFPGTYGRPYNQKTSEFSTTSFMNEAMSRGRFVVQLAYDNYDSVNFACNDLGKKIDNCAGLLRHTKMEGGYHKLGSTRNADSIQQRITVLLEYLNSKYIFSTKLNPGWDQFEVSGHSQGGGFAHYIAKFYGVKKACLIAGGYDSPDHVGPKKAFADWILEPMMATPIENINGVVHTDDKHYSVFSLVYEYLGLYEVGNVQESSVQPMTLSDGSLTTDGHKGIIASVETRRQRVKGCFH